MKKLAEYLTPGKNYGRVPHPCTPLLLHSAPMLVGAVL